MTEQDIRDRVELLCAAEVDPALTEDELDAAMAEGAAADVDGRAPSDPDWEGAWDVAAVAAAAWRIKAAKVSEYMSFSSDGASFNAHQVFEHCMRMADWYAARTGVITYPGDDTPVTPPVGGVGWVDATTVYTTGTDRLPAWAGGLIP